jgi:hypothetical protein
MARTTKQLSGGGKDKFLRAIIASEPAVPPDAADRVAGKLAEAISDVRVRREAWEIWSKVVPPTPRRRPGERPALRAGTANSLGNSAETAEPSPPTASAVSEAAPFDPFAFSALALLTRQGREGLATALDKITSPAHLKELANAQHLAIDPATESADELRRALIAATERRLADRRAAAG